MNRRYGSILKLLGLAAAVFLVMVLVWGSLGWHICNLFVSQIVNMESLVREVAVEEGVINIEEVNYQKEGVEASFPRLLSDGKPDSLERINKLIEQDFDKIIQIYSFQPFPGPTPSYTDVVPIILRISYEVKGNTDSWLSLFYRADYSSTYSAHPSNLVYTTNIDKQLDRRLQLSDIVMLNEDFIKDFRTWKLNDNAEIPSEVQEAITDYMKQISDEDLLTGFRSADQIGSNNPWGIYSYLTKDSIGISVEVPHYAGDHAEFEQSLAVLEGKGLLRRN